MENMMELRNGSFLNEEQQQLVERIGNASEENGKALELFGHDMYSQGYLAGTADECNRWSERSKHSTRNVAVLTGIAAAGATALGSLVTYLVMKDRYKKKVTIVPKDYKEDDED